MEVINGQVENISLRNRCDPNVDIAMLPVGLLIGNDNLGNLKVLERTTQRPALPSPRQINTENGNELQVNAVNGSERSELQDEAQNLGKVSVTGKPAPAPNPSKISNGTAAPDSPRTMQNGDRTLRETSKPSPNQLKGVINISKSLSPIHVKEVSTTQALHSPSSPSRRTIESSRRGSNEVQRSSFSSSLVKIASNKHPSPRDKTSRDMRTRQTTTPEVKQRTATPQKTAQKLKITNKDAKAPQSPSHQDNVSVSITQKTERPTTHGITPTSSTPMQNGHHRAPETTTSVDIDIECNGDTSTQPETYESVHQLKRMRIQLLRNIEQIDFKLSNMKKQRSALFSLSSHMKESSDAAFELKRNNQGVPFVNAVKELVKRKHDAYHEHTNNVAIYQATLPFYADLKTIFKTFSQVCERIILTTVNYNVTYLEDFHLMAGKVCGMIQCIVVLYYDDVIGVHQEDTHNGVLNKEDCIDPDYKPRAEPPYMSGTETLLKECRLSGPEVLLRKHRTNEEILKGLELLGDILSRSNECLANISRLSLGNPKNQSLYDAFVTVATILKESESLVHKFEELNLPCVKMLKEALLKASKIADVNKPGEKQVEELKYSLGECDGHLFITAKYIFG